MENYTDFITILYVEDEKEVQEGYSRTLQRVSKELFTADDGALGLDLYKKYMPDIVISDIKMPNMDGLDMVKAIKEINEKAKIIFTTAHSESNYLLDAINLHVDGYIIKPIQKNTLVSMIQKMAKTIMLERENTKQKEILQHIIDSENSISMITDKSDITFANKSFLNLFNTPTLEEFKKKFPTIIDIFSNKTNHIGREDIQQSINKHENLYDFIHHIKEEDRITTLQNGDGKDNSYYTSISKINEHNFLTIFTDITKLERDRENISKKVYTDQLTGVYNRNKFEEVFKYELKRSKRYTQPLSIAILDIDDFKKVNDTFGHLVGDEVLTAISKKIQKNIRETDLFARWGGEEFVILFNNTDLQSAIKTTEKFKDILQDIKHKTAKTVTASFGVTQLKADDSIKSMLKRADEALYMAKGSGKNIVKFIK